MVPSQRWDLPEGPFLNLLTPVCELHAQETKQQRSLRHRAVAMQPLPIPLPFPSIFTPAVSPLGGILQPGQVASAVPSRSHVRSTPILTRLQHTAASRQASCACPAALTLTSENPALCFADERPCYSSHAYAGPLNMPTLCCALQGSVAGLP